MSRGIEARITTLIASTLHVDEAGISRETRMAGELGAESLDAVTLVLSIEDEFNIDIHDEDAAELLTVGQLMDYVLAELPMKDITAERYASRTVSAALG